MTTAADRAALSLLVSLQPLGFQLFTRTGMTVAAHRCVPSLTWQHTPYPWVRS